jgi:Secretion system C-terminal sorting domain
MKTKIYILTILIIHSIGTVSTKASGGGCDSLVSPCLNTFSQNGFYLELESTINTLIESFATISQNGGSRDVEIYHRAGSFVGFEGDPAGWTLLGSTTGFSPLNALSCPIPETTIPIAVNYCMQANQRHSFYIMRVSGSGTFESHQNIPRGQVAASDGTLSLYSGKTSQGFYAFHPSFINDSMSFQGTIQYSCGCTPVGISENRNENTISAYPVPASDDILFTFAKSLASDAEIRIYNVKGELVEMRKANIGENQFRFNISSYNSGIYSFVVSDTSSGRVSRRLFVKQ